MGRCISVTPISQLGRQPLGYVCRLPFEKTLFVPGHYEIANGGIDTLPHLSIAYDLIAKHHNNSDVLFEGKNFTDRGKHLIKMLKDDVDVRVIFLDHPLDDCIASVRKRGHKIKNETIESLYKKCQDDFKTMYRHSMVCLYLTREQTLQQICKWLSLPLEGQSHAYIESAKRR